MATGTSGRGGHGGVVRTPPGLAERLARRLLDAAPAGASFLDPACGDGELLLALLRTVGTDPARGRLHGIEIDPRLVRRARERLGSAAGRGELAARIRRADALAADPWPGGTWILANPPWLSFSGRHAGPNRGASSGPPAGGGWPALHSAYLARIARHVAEEGTGAALLLPGSVTELERYGPTRAVVTAWSQLEGAPRELGEDAFPGVLEPAVELLLLPRSAAGPGSERPWTAPGEGAPLLAELAKAPRLPARTFADPGVHTGNAAGLLVLPAGDEGSPGLRQGRDLAPYRLGPPSARLRTDVERAAGIRFRVGPLERYRSFPVLLRQTADRPKAALHASPTYFRNSLLACRAVEGLDPAFVVAVLNAPTATAWHRLRFRDARQRTFPQVKVRHLASQPFPIVHRDQDPKLHDDLAAFARAPELADEKAEEIAERLMDAFGLSPNARAIVARTTDGRDAHARRPPSKR